MIILSPLSRLKKMMKHFAHQLGVVTARVSCPVPTHEEKFSKDLKRITTPTHRPVVNTDVRRIGSWWRAAAAAAHLCHNPTTPTSPSTWISIYPTNLTPDKSQKCEATLSLSFHMSDVLPQWPACLAWQKRPGFSILFSLFLFSGHSNSPPVCITLTKESAG